MVSLASLCFGELLGCLSELREVIQIYYREHYRGFTVVATGQRYTGQGAGMGGVAPPDTLQEPSNPEALSVLCISLANLQPLALPRDYRWD